MLLVIGGAVASVVGKVEKGTMAVVEDTYGRELIESALPYTLNATMSFELHHDGVSCKIELPLTDPSSPGEREQ